MSGGGCGRLANSESRIVGPSSATILSPFLFAIRYSLLSPDQEPVAGANPCQEAAHILKRDGDAAFGRAAVRPFEMEEDGAAEMRPRRRVVVAEDEQDVVEAVVAPH